jgi:hypothetical protein
MMKIISRNLSKIILAILLLILGVFIGLLTEVLGDDFKRFLEFHQINNPTIWIILFAILIFAIVITAYDVLRSDKEDSAGKAASDNDIEPDVKKFHASLKERYQKRYESKLDERFEITLEVSENWDGHKTQTFNERYDKDAKISEAFPKIKSLLETKNGLLIVGEPGAGKTVLLLNAALNLLEKTNFAAKEAFPVIFNLASWNDKEYENFGEWLKSMLVSGNGLSKDFAALLLKEKRLILLLDGLDELARNEDKTVAAKNRAACLKALNNYLDGEKNVICCRIDEFVAMQQNTAQDAPVSAKVEVLNLTEAEVLNELQKAQNHKDTKHHASAKNLSEIFVKEENAALRKVLCTPFYITVALEVFYKHIPDEINLPKDEDKLRTYLIEKYVERKLDKTLNPNNFDKEKTMQWLKWLAKLMEKKQIITFELADLQPIDLITYRHYILSVGLVSGLVSGLFNGLVYGLYGGLKFGLILGLEYGLLFGLGMTSSISFGKYNISSARIVNLDISRLLNLNYWKKTLLPLCVGLFIGLLVGLFDNLGIGLGIGLFYGLAFCLLFASEGLKKNERVTYLQNPYQRIYGGFFVNLVFAFVISLTLICFTLSLNYMARSILNIISISLMLSVIFFLLMLTINTALFFHSCLRFCLYLEDSMPLRYATFLDYASSLRILEKDGGHWRFRHQNLQVYFADLDEQKQT